MKDYKKSAKFTYYVTCFLMVVLLALVIVLPFGVTWYVEKMHRPADLATVVMLTCYPCTPLAAVLLFSLNRLTKNISKGDILIDKNLAYLKRSSLSCFIAGLIMLISGFFYMPFYIASGSALLCSVFMKVTYDILRYYIEKKD